MRDLFDLSYKLQIQSLRGIAIILIFFYHLDPEIFSNGYLGADIFFVISGYVITQKLIKDYILKKKIDIGSFLINRFKRIYPTLFLVIFATIIFYILWGPLDLLIGKFFEAFFSILGLSNIYFLQIKKDFFDTVFLSPLRHTWSLGVELQFYLFFPMLFYFYFKIFKSKTKIHLKSLTALVCFALSILILFFIESRPDKNLYFLQYYTFNYFPILPFIEILVGSILFLVFKGKSKKNDLIFLLSLILLILIFTIDTGLPSYLTNIMVALISCLLILCFNKKSFSSHLINNFVFNHFGLISYAIYLWHLPIIYFSTLYYGKFESILISIFVSFLLSNFSYYNIENKFRYFTPKIKPKLFVVSGFIVIVAVVIFNKIIFSYYNVHLIKSQFKVFVNKVNYLEKKLNYSERTIFYNLNINGKKVYRYCQKNSKNFKINKFNLKNECLKSQNQKKLIYLEGASKTAQFIPLLNSSTYVDNFYFEHLIAIFKDPGDKISFDKINFQLSNFEKIIYATSFTSLEELEYLEANLSKFHNNIEILILGPVPYVNEKAKPLECFIKQIDCHYLTSEDIKNRNLRKFYEKINSLLKMNKKIFFYDPYKIICPQDKCYVYDKSRDILTHIDNKHLSQEGSRLLIKDFNEFYRNKLN